MKKIIMLVLISQIFIIQGCDKSRDVKHSDSIMPIIFYKGHVYIKGSINGIEGDFVFDTAATNLYFDDIFYSESNFKFKNTIVGLLPGAGVKPQRVKVIMDSVYFDFDKNKYKTTKVPIFKLKPILGDIADGVVGIDCFDNSILEINYENKYMKLHSDINFLDTISSSKIQLTKKGNRLYVPLTVRFNDTINISGEYLLDFGSGSTISLTSLVAQKHRLKDNIDLKEHYYTKYGGVGGNSERYDFIANSVLIGDFDFNDVVINFSNDDRGALASEKYLGLLGNEIYKRFNVVIDFKDNSLYLKPNKNYKELFESSRLGFSYVDRSETLKSWIVTGLYSKSNAYNSGLKIDDEIIAVNDVEIEDIDFRKQKLFFNNQNQIKLKVKRDKKVFFFDFKLQDFLTEN